jgi:hypothetical protein
MGRDHERTSWGCLLQCWDPSVLGDLPGGRVWGEGKPALASTCWPEAARCTTERHCIGDIPTGASGKSKVFQGVPGSNWQLKASNIPELSGTTDPKRRNLCGLRSAVSLDALIQQFPELPAPSPAQASGLCEKLSLASECLFAARHEIQRSIRTPISLFDISALSDLVRKVSDLLAADSVTTVLGRPVSRQELAETGYRLLDSASEYHILAQHFFSDEVQAARISRPSDVVEAEIAAVTRKATSFKLEVMKYLKKAAEALQ